MSIRADYLTIVSYLSSKLGYSTRKTRKILTELGKGMKEAISRGNDIEVENLFKIKYKLSKIPKTVIYSNTEYNFENQVDYVVEKTGYSKLDVHRVIKNYYSYINELVSEGYKVTVKSIGVLEPRYSEHYQEYETVVIISPVLTSCKADNIDLLCMDSNGEKETLNVSKENLRFSLFLSSNLNMPTKSISSKITLDYIDI